MKFAVKTGALVAIAALSFTLSTEAAAQLGRQQGLVEPNVAAEAALLALPGITADIALTLKNARPILSVVTLDSILAAKALTKPQRTALYDKMFVHVDLNRGTDAEFMLIPGVDANKLKAIKAAQPWKSFEQFQTEIAKTSTPAEAMRLEKYLFIPIDLNRASDALMGTFASIGVGTSKWMHEFEEYRPWTSMAQFEPKIGKYLIGNPGELKRLQRYVIINP